MRYRDRGQSDCLHPPVCVDQCIKLHCHLTGLWCVVPSPLIPFFDILLDEESQLQRNTQTFVVVSDDAGGKQVTVLRVEKLVPRLCLVAHAWKCPPFGSQVILRSKEYGYQYLYSAFSFYSIGEASGTFIFVIVEAAGKKHAREVPN